jgi:hypothetical protein
MYMDTIITLNSNYEFIELNRTFHELPKHSTESDEIEIIQAFHFGERISWRSLIKEYRLIILSEAGSGKTFEIRNVARTLREQGKSTFFLRLEHIPRDFEDAFEEVETYEAFKAWLASNEEGWLLLDSVDEARLRNPGDFELAIRKLSRRISTAKDRTHIVITGRTTAWRPKTDLAHCTAQLPYAVTDTSKVDPKDGNDGPDDSVPTKTEKRVEPQQVFKIVALDDLTREQIAVFIKARGIKDSNAFLNSVERADAWSFTTRPQDLQELVEFWIDNGRIGTRLEIMRNSINRRLDERDQCRAEARPLSADKARQGSRHLAAATTLAQNPTIRVPDGADNTKGIAIQSVLTDWDDKDQAALLARPIFDEAIYGAVRFHHRSVREYLTAEWFAELLNRETSRRKIEGLFFSNQYSLDIVTPTLRPILPWLAIMDEKILERVRKIAPEIILEGGDPSQLPLAIRRYILHEVCEQMADNTTVRSMRDYAAVQRFANPDLTDDVRALLHKYSDNEDLTAYLLRMVWLGQLAGALPDAMKVALSPAAERYTRITAFRAIKAVGSKKDQELVRQSFLAEAAVLKRDWINELIEGVQPTEKIIIWLLACLEKSEPKAAYTVDNLIYSVTELVETAEIEMLEQLIIGFNKLLSCPPVIERRHCEVSEKYQWLMVPACKAVEQLIIARDPASLRPDVLAILHKFSAMRGYASHELNEVKVDFSKLVPAWKELNRALFWFEVRRSREVLDKKRDERLTNFWHASIFGSFWRFEEGDFEYAAEEISRQALLDDRLVALSLAFDLYRSANRPRKWLVQLKKLVSGNDGLSERMGTYLRPPAQSRDSGRWKQQEAEWKRRAEASRKKKEKYHADWKKYFNDKLGDARAALREKPGTLTNPLLYLFDQTRTEKNITNRWTEYNWKTLIPEYGEEVGRFYRDATVSFWRHHKPKLHSEGAPFNQTSFSVIIGLVGIEIEAHETKDWPKKLSDTEVESACRYASFELNGFPTWFPKLFETYPKIVCDFLMREVRYELSIEKPETETHYFISDLSWSGQWSWNQIAPRIYELLKTKEPKNLSNLDKLLKIIQGSNLPDDLIKELSYRKCCTLKRLDHLAHWFAVWTGIAPDRAIAALKVRIGKIAAPKKRTWFAMTFVTHLLGSRRGDGAAVRQAFKTPGYLKLLYLLMHENIRRKEDINRAGMGVYTPELRDDAQDARNSLFELLNKIPGKESFLALKDIAEQHPEESSRPWVMHLAKTKAEQDGDIQPWSPAQVRDFHDKLECTPRNHKELAELAVLRLLDLKDDLENGDSSISNILKTVEQEVEIRKYIGRELREKAYGRYSIPQEEEFANAQRPDLRFHGTGFDGPVPVELKLADNWSGPELFERFENQLCGDYLRDNHSNRGIFVLVYRGNKTGWDVPNRDNRVDFTELITALRERWNCISSKYSNVDEITVIGIDLTKRSC